MHVAVRTSSLHRVPESPYLSLDLSAVRANYRALAAVLPDAQIRYAVKANPAEPVLALLADEGAHFDVASVGEVDLCRTVGIAGPAMTFGNPIKKPAQVRHAFAAGVDGYTFDTADGAAVIAENAPGARVECRIGPSVPASVTPFGAKFGCPPERAAELLQEAARLGLRPDGVCFHVGSQQLDPRAWEIGIAAAAEIFAAVPQLTTLNIGGGLPIGYLQAAPQWDALAATITAALARHFGATPPRLVVEPGRALVGSAGTLVCEVVAVRVGTDGRRWVYLDVGRYGGLAETENEYIRYRLSTDRDHDPTHDVVIAGPTCDGDDVLYQNYPLPVTLRAGDAVRIEAAGAYTTSYSSIAFNGFPPLTTHFPEVPDAVSDH